MNTTALSIVEPKTYSTSGYDRQKQKMARKTKDIDKYIQITKEEFEK